MTQKRRGADFHSDAGDPPCHWCGERTDWCHATCKHYAKYRAKREAIYAQRESLARLRQNENINKSKARVLREKIKKRSK